MKLYSTFKESNKWSTICQVLVGEYLEVLNGKSMKKCYSLTLIISCKLVYF